MTADLTPGSTAASNADAAPSTIRVGTSGYSFRDWVGPFYPPGTPARAQFEYYTRFFRCLELNVTYYRVPDAKLMAGMCERTPAGFEFIVKLHADITHQHSRDDALYASFRTALQPLEDAGRMQGLLAQFPFSFKNVETNRAFLAELRQRFEPRPLFVEFRHASWIVEPVFAFLAGQHIGYVSVDEPQLRDLVPPIVRATTDVGYVRLHGRNATTWYASGPEAGDRYDYRYNGAELLDWRHKIVALARRTRKTFVFFNNCHAGNAAVNALAMLDLLSDTPGASAAP
jgi:uncharacterized protein YecE (DUF72 family)